MYATILNFESGQVEVLDLCNMPEGMEAEEYIEVTLEYSLSNCEWMTTPNKPELQFLN